jgi:hypothetical protein
MERSSNPDYEPKPMQNIEMIIVNGRLILQVDLTKEIGPSSTGKTIRIAGSGTKPRIPGYDNVRFHLEVFKFPDAVAQ